MCLNTNEISNKNGFRQPKTISYKDGDFAILLRPIEISDAKAIDESIRLSINNLLPFMDWAHRELSVEKQVERILRSIENYWKSIEFDFSVVDNNTQDFQMSATLGVSRTLNTNALSIGYWTSDKYANKGLATLVTKILIVVAFEYMRCDRVEIGCNKSNIKSRRVIEKCNFIFEGQVRNYFSEPTPEMVNKGYSQDTTYMQYSLIKQDLKTVAWFNEIKRNIIFTS